ncbi:MAG: DUF1905 domain-containing protein, partial [Bacteroidetes bacterium]|nr:DUF1905 domain-containing protein [Bacteroidota bacterium]
DVPIEISQKMKAHKGYIKIKGRINKFDFTKNLVPVKNSPYRLFVNKEMMKGGKTAVGETATFVIEQDLVRVVKEYPTPNLLLKALDKNKLVSDFNNLTPSRKKDILKYLNNAKTVETAVKNINSPISFICKENFAP